MGNAYAERVAVVPMLGDRIVEALHRWRQGAGVVEVQLVVGRPEGALIDQFDGGSPLVEIERRGQVEGRRQRQVDAGVPLVEDRRGRWNAGADDGVDGGIAFLRHGDLGAVGRCQVDAVGGLEVECQVVAEIPGIALHVPPGRHHEGIGKLVADHLAAAVEDPQAATDGQPVVEAVARRGVDLDRLQGELLGECTIHPFPALGEPAGGYHRYTEAGIAHRRADIVDGRNQEVFGLGGVGVGRSQRVPAGEIDAAQLDEGGIHLQRCPVRVEYHGCRIVVRSVGAMRVGDIGAGEGGGVDGLLR